jgi:DNA processing protein
VAWLRNQQLPAAAAVLLPSAASALAPLPAGQLLVLRVTLEVLQLLRAVLAAAARDLAPADACHVARSLPLEELLPACCELIAMEGLSYSCRVQAAGVISGTVAALQAGPAQNRSLFAEIVAAGGCILTEQPLGCRPFDTLFVARNRTIAALSLGTLVVRAPVQSGALTTAGFARRLQRPVGVLPGAPWEPSAVGSNSLLGRGATAITRAEELATLLGTALSEGSLALPLVPAAAQSVAVPSVGLSEAANRLWAVLSETWEEGDDVVRLSGLAGGEAVAALTELELDGLLERRGTQWRRARR